AARRLLRGGQADLPDYFWPTILQGIRCERRRGLQGHRRRRGGEGRPPHHHPQSAQAVEKAPGVRIRETIVAAGLITAFSAAFLAPREAAAQQVPPIAPRDSTWGTISNVTMILGAGIVTLMPRVYYNDPEATVGWKGRWHISMLA